MSKILVVGLNPAWQRVLSFSIMALGEVNRADASVSLASGKGINTAKVLAKMGHSVSILQILAGENGIRCLKACGEWNLHALNAFVKGKTRQCTTLLDDHGTATEIIEPFAVTELNVEKELLAHFENHPSYDAVVICGSVPQGISDSIYGDVLGAVKTSKIIWDSVAGLSEDLLPRISWMKLNAEEFSKLSSAKNSLGKTKWPRTLITDGPKPAKVLHSESADGLYPLPALTQMRNPIGAGDTVTALLTDGLLRDMDEESAVKRALAFGAASCLSPLPAEFNLEDALALETKMESKIPDVQS